MAATQEPQAGQLVGDRYRLGRHLGDGRTGKVFQARDRDNGEKVALKLLHRPLCSVADEVTRFGREFEVTRQIDHPHTVRMLAFGEQDDGPLEGVHYLVMEYIKGKGLDTLLVQGPLELSRAVHIALQVARGLEAAHREKVVHRDLKPGNIRIERRAGSDHAKVLDFGLAHLQGGDDEAGGLTGFGVRLGTVEYMCPEYITDFELDHRSDLYGLGAVLFETLVGQPPFIGRSMKVMQDHVSAPVPRPSSNVPAIPPWLDDLVAQLMAKDPGARPQTANEVVEILEDHLDEIDTNWRIQRQAVRSSSGRNPTPRLSSVGAAGWSTRPVYDDPKPAVPPTPIAVTVALVSLALFGVVSLAGIGVFVLSSVLLG